MSEYKLLDTGAFNAFIENQDDFVKEYEEIEKEYISIVKDLIAIWKGRGATAFSDDAAIVKSNIVGVGEILQTMCDMLIDCREVFDECDRAVGKSNRKATKGE